MLRRMTQITLSGLLLTVAVSALAASGLGHSDHGVTGALDGDVVTYVVPGSPTWRDGIRPAQRVIELADSAAPGGWRIMTTDGEVIRESFGASHMEILRLHVWWALPALLFAMFVAFLSYRQHRGAAPLLPLAIGAAAQPLFAVGRADLTTAAGVAVFLGGGLAVAAFSRWGRRSAILPGIGLVLATAWAAATLLTPAAFDAIDALRTPTAVGFAGLGLTTVLDRGRTGGLLTKRPDVGFVDLAYLAAAVGLAAVLAIVAGVPLPVLLAAGVAGLAIYPFWRRRTLAVLDRLLTAPARQEAAIRAVEDERGRLARDIHDAPLQDLTGVIRRLESVPGTEAEMKALRDVAAQLRDVATALHPPVLQDLGLPAAVEDLTDQLSAARPDWHIDTVMDDLTGGVRPPAEVELAAFRIVQEASVNALAHSKGQTLSIQGAVASDTLELSIADDGQGIMPDLARAARRNGHFGLDSMRERANAVGGKSTITSDSGGLTVTFRWERAG